MVEQPFFKPSCPHMCQSPLEIIVKNNNSNAVTIGSGGGTTPPSTKEYTITASADSNSVITPKGVQTVKENGKITFTFSADSGYVVSDLLIDGVSRKEFIPTGSYSFSTVLINHTISVSSVKDDSTGTGDGDGGDGGDGDESGIDDGSDNKNDTALILIAVIAVVIVVIAAVLWIRSPSRKG
ncbi:MAG: hypothetical protein LBM39_02730 [Candidatus Methanoplasma sp.]|jgi:hypothetical protein|nr:hypothetical protein [Candidatus Methanoplasma sp.]